MLRVTAPHSWKRLDVARIVLGTMLLPIVATVAAFLIHPLVWPTGPYEGSRWGDPVDAAQSFAAGVAIVAVVVTAIGAIPATLWLVSTRRISFSSLMLTAVACGNAPFAISAVGTVVFYLAGQASWTDVRYVVADGPLGLFRATAVGSGLGALCGLAFWLVAVAGRTTHPDDQSNSCEYEV